MSDDLPSGLDPDILHRVVTVEATARHLAGMQHEATVHDFTFVSDEPEDLGGSDEFPYPLDYLTAAIGL